MWCWEYKLSTTRGEWARKKMKIKCCKSAEKMKNEGASASLFFRLFSCNINKVGHFLGTFSAFLLQVWALFRTFAFEQII